MEWAKNLMTEFNFFEKEHFKKLKQTIQDLMYDKTATKSELHKAMCRLGDDFKPEFVNDILAKN